LSIIADTFDFVAYTVDFVAGFGDKVEFDSLSQSTLSLTRSTLSKVGDFCCPNVERSFDFVANVYQA